MTCSHVRFVGGGRWATIVLTELVQTFPYLAIDWVCNSNADDKKEFIKNSSLFENTNAIDNKNIEELSKPDKVIIASHSIQHCSDLLLHGNNDVDVLIEKPLYPNLSDFEILSEKKKRRTFLNLEFYNAFFISDFISQIRSLDIKNINFFWHDPLTENRDMEESKNSEIFSSIFMDQLLHVMSIAKLMKLDCTNCKQIKVFNNHSKPDGSINICADLGGVKVEISLSRFAKKRERIIDINLGEISLDFTSESIIKKKGKRVEEISASGRLFPISQTLTEFINYPNQSNAFSLSLRSLMPEIKFCFECEDLFIDKTSNQLDFYREGKKGQYKIVPNLVYYAGIMYYRKKTTSLPHSGIHYSKGFNGVQDLISWWHNSETNN